MTDDHASDMGTNSKEFHRRDFIKLAVAAGLMAGCRPILEPSNTPTDAPTPSPGVTPPAVLVEASATSSATPTLIPPDKPSPVVVARHAGVWDGGALVPNAIKQMLDGSITALTGLNDAGEAWASLFSPSERIAIKVNSVMGGGGWTHLPLVMAVAEQLQGIGTPPEQIVIFDRDTRDLTHAGYPVNQQGPGVRCYGTDNSYSSGWRLMDNAEGPIGFSNVLMGCNALINMPILKEHLVTGITFALKNHYGTFNKPEVYHGARSYQALPELNSLPPIRDRARLIIGDALQIILGQRWDQVESGNAICMSFDPVAHDTVGLQLFSDVLVAGNRNPAKFTRRVNTWLANGAAMGLGTNDPNYIALREVALR